MIAKFLLERFGSSFSLPSTQNDEDLVRTLLAEQPQRLEHTLGVVQRAKELVSLLDYNQVFFARLMKAAYFHDIGYATVLRITNFHPLDGALFLARQNADDEVIHAVLFHSGAAGDAENQPIPSTIYKEIAFPHSLFLLNALTFCDLRTSSEGKKISVGQRLEEICHRYGADHEVTKNMIKMKPEFNRACQAVLQQVAKSFPGTEKQKEDVLKKLKSEVQAVMMQSSVDATLPSAQRRGSL